MIKNIKIHNIINIIEISKSMGSNKCIHKKNYENIYLNVSYDFLKSDGLKKIKCNILNGTTQGWACFYRCCFPFIDREC